MIESQAIFEDWKDSPVGREWFNMLIVMREDMKELLAGGITLKPDSVDFTALQTAHLVGGIEVLNKVIYFKVEGED